jgi:hypothetical protein
MPGLMTAVSSAATAVTSAATAVTSAATSVISAATSGKLNKLNPIYKLCCDLSAPNPCIMIMITYFL